MRNFTSSSQGQVSLFRRMLSWTRVGISLVKATLIGSQANQAIGEQLRGLSSGKGRERKLYLKIRLRDKDVRFS